MRNAGWIVLVGLMSCAEGTSSTQGAAGSTEAGHGGGGVGGESQPSGGAGSTSYEGASGMSGADAGVVNTACPMVKDLAKSCGIAVPDKECKPDAFCKDSCTLSLSCAELRDLVSGIMSDSLTACFEECKQH